MRRNNYKEMIDKKFGLLHIENVIKKENKTFISCKCDCGKYLELRPYPVFKKLIVSCGCYKNRNLEKGHMKVKNLISYDEMLKEVNKNKTDKQIAQEYGFNRTTIGLLRREYGIKSKFSDKKSSINEMLLTQEQKEIIIGTIFGDGSINSAGNLRIGHSTNQYPYIYWLHHKLKSISFNLCSNSKTNSFSFGTRSLNFLKDLRKKLYPYGTKIVTEDVLWLLTPLSLAIWFMDDGGLMGSQNFLSTEGFTHADRKIITDYFWNKWKLTTTIRRHFSKKQSKYYYAHFFNAENSFKLAQIIKNHLLPSMLYKIRKDARKHIVYLAGGMQSSPDGGVKWRRNLKLLLNQKGYYCIDPTKEENFMLLNECWKNDIENNFELFQKNMRSIIVNDLDFVDKSESIVCLYDEFLGGGSYHEIGESYLKNKKLYIININKLPLSKLSWWVLGCATKIVNTYEELLNLFPDINNEKYIRKNGLLGKKRR